MWQCKNCQETVDAGFEVCWQCGTSRAGVADPNFRRADEISAQDVDSTAPLNTSERVETNICADPVKLIERRDEKDARNAYQTLAVIFKAVLGMTLGLFGGTFLGVLGPWVLESWLTQQPENAHGAGVIILVVVTAPVGGIIGAISGGLIAVAPWRQS